MLPEFLIQSASEVKSALTLRNQRLVLAESCTGGLVSTLLTSLPGISDFFCGSAVVYRWDTKMKWLGVQAETLETFTDVSRETAREMALGVLRQTPEASLSAAITGHLGPNAPQEQDGLVCIAIAERALSDLSVPPELVMCEAFRTDLLLEEISRQESLVSELPLRQQRQLAAADQMLSLITKALEKE